MKNIIYDYFSTGDANENFCQRGTKRDMNTAAQDLQEMIAGSELCVGTKLCSTMRTLKDTAYLSTPQPYYGPIPEDRKHEQLSPFGAASVVYAIVVVHNVNVSLVVHNITESDDGDVPVVTSKHLQRGIIYVPVSPLMRQQLKSIRETRLISCTHRWEISKIASRHTLRRMDYRPKTKISCVLTTNSTSSSISRVRATPRESIVLPIHLPARNVVARAPRSLISVEHPALVNAWYSYLYTWDPIH
jgi:hypothetical protein